ncbi:hypothetical protein [Zobellia nedashkovskayae]|uniref:hypothetical protein n=1 Tax=Zobellia nedashkovskayae TaxID=2779510 RepID=UPI0039F09C16
MSLNQVNFNGIDCKRLPVNLLTPLAIAAPIISQKLNRGRVKCAELTLYDA